MTHGWDNAAWRRLKGPIRAFDIRDVADGGWIGGLGAAHRSARRDPAFEQSDFSGRQLGLRRHLAVAHPLEQAARVRFTRDDRRAGFAAGKRQSSQPQIQPAFLLSILAVAMETVRFEQRSNMFFVGQCRLGAERRRRRYPERRDHEHRRKEQRR